MYITKIKEQTCAAGDIVLYRIENASGASVELCNVGAGVTSLCVPDRRGYLADVALGYRNPQDYIGDGPCCGKTPGRYANRIANGRFTLEGKEYQLGINNGPNHLHGGVGGFANRLWESRIEQAKVLFTLHSADGDENYPGALTARVEYEWSDDNVLTISYSADSDATTIVNLTNHAYFNLAGHDSGSVLAHTLRLHASHWLPTDATLIPTGEIADVGGTPMDFREAKALGRDIDADFDALRFGKGYDNCWVVDPCAAGGVCPVAELQEPISGRVLRVSSDQAGVQVYTGNWLSGSPERKCGGIYNDYDGVAIECQALPDAPNKEQFPSAVLRRGEEYRRTIKYAFSVQ